MIMGFIRVERIVGFMGKSVKRAVSSQFLADHVCQSAGRVVPAQEKNRWPSTTHKLVGYSCCANGLYQWIVPVSCVVVGFYFFKKY